MLNVCFGDWGGGELVDHQFDDDLTRGEFEFSVPFSARFPPALAAEEGGSLQMSEASLTSVGGAGQYRGCDSTGCNYPGGGSTKRPIGKPFRQLLIMPARDERALPLLELLGQQTCFGALPHGSLAKLPSPHGSASASLPSSLSSTQRATGHVRSKLLVSGLLEASRREAPRVPTAGLCCCPV